MADDIEPWSRPPAERRDSGDRPVYRFGVAQELERLQADPNAWAPRPDEPLPNHFHPLDHRPWQCWSEARRTYVYGRTWTHLRTKRASRDKGLSDHWHRMLCWCGRHDFRGGEQVQLGSRFVHVERRCHWCHAAPSN